MDTGTDTVLGMRGRLSDPTRAVTMKGTLCDSDLDPNADFPNQYGTVASFRREHGLIHRRIY